MSATPDLDSGFDPNNAQTWDERQHQVYETGHREGESCKDMDWISTLSDEFNIDAETIDDAMEKLKALIEQRERAVLDKAADYNFHIQQPCEPDCDEVRHAFHEGNWVQYWGMREYFDRQLEQLAEEQ